MSDFKKFSQAVHAQYAEMAKGELFTIAINPDELYAAYLAAFPEGSNPIFRERTEHDCSCCRNFIKNIGNVVSIVDGAIHTVWGVIGLDEPYRTVAGALAEQVKAAPIDGIFRSKERIYGAESSKEIKEDGTVRTWNHFHAEVTGRHFTETPGAAIGSYATTAAVFKRGLEELTADALTTVIDLAEANNLYKGEEFLPALREFRRLKSQYLEMAESAKNLFIWANASSSASRFRNTAIGTLIQDLSEGADVERAVKSYESKVAPTNYKRPSAIITPRMVADAMKTISELGLEPALQRRHANIGDITINNVLWADKSAAKLMKGGIESLLMEAAVAPAASMAKPEDIAIADFMANILPQAQSIDLLVKSSQQGNFMSITAPVHADAKPLFKWDNGFAWTYDGSVTDSIKERVKAAGGTVEGDLCCRLAWDYTDDLDFHMHEPDGGRIYFGVRRQLSKNGGMLDLDANGADGQRGDPSENIFYADRRKMREGIYTLIVNNYNRRSNGVGFTVEIEFDGQVHSIASDKILPDSKSVTVAKIQYKAGVFNVIESMPANKGAAKGVDKWGVKTEQPTKVSTIMYSPNHWDGNSVGNRHYFFIMEGCRNPDPARGIYNEFLSSDLEKHRKVFETIGDKTKCAPADNQLSGVGFSSTKGDSVVVNVTGAKLRKTYNITF